MKKPTEEKISKLGIIEQSSQRLLSQKHSYQNELLEVESALDELSSSSASYKIIGNIMVKADSQKLKAELVERTKIISTRLKNLDSQEKKLMEQAEALQAEVLKELEGD